MSASKSRLSATTSAIMRRNTARASRDRSPLAPPFSTIRRTTAKLQVMRRRMTALDDRADKLEREVADLRRRFAEREAELADRHRRGVAGNQFLARRSRASVRRDAGKGDAVVRRLSREPNRIRRRAIPM